MFSAIGAPTTKFNSPGTQLGSAMVPSTSMATHLRSCSSGCVKYFFTIHASRETQHLRKKSQSPSHMPPRQSFLYAANRLRDAIQIHLLLDDLCVAIRDPLHLYTHGRDWALSPFSARRSFFLRAAKGMIWRARQ